VADVQSYARGVSTPAVPVEPALRVSTLELFFDLVFVFTITQLTGVLAAGLALAGVLRVLLMLGVIWWMYDGYAWLTNAVAPTDGWRRSLLFVGMAGFLTIALSIPGAFGPAGWAFGVGYFVVNLVHTGLFVKAGGRGAVQAMSRLGPLNLLSASLVLAGGFVPGGWRDLLWAGAFAVQAASPYLHRIEGFTVEAAHFVERHGLVVIIALGESVVAIGVGAGALPLTLGLIGVAVLGLLIAYFLWWVYFGGDETGAEHALGAVPVQRRARVAIVAYGYAHYLILFSVVLLAAGVKKAIGHAFGPLPWPYGAALGGGVALFLLGDLGFRGALRIGRPWYRLAAAGLAVLTIPLGPVRAVAQLTALVVVLGGLRLVEARAGAATERFGVVPAR
jgi:low temperature requirement protein LtrA